MTSAQSVSKRVVMQTTPASKDPDTATRQTVEKMSDYIRDAIADPAVRACADYAWKRFGLSSPSPEAKCWAVFWWVKHCISFRQDEATMFRVGLHDEQDLLIAPSVLVRMADPAEDCDGFTMLGSAMLAILGIPVYIGTAAADHSRPQEFSHVFPIAKIGDRVLPLDMSHGPRPGWMIPRRDVLRFQAWGLDGKPTNDITVPTFQGLHGYVRVGNGLAGGRVRFTRPGLRRGVGDWDEAGNYIPDPPTSYQAPDTSTPVVFSSPPATATTPAGGSSQWANILGALGAGGLNLANTLLKPPAYVQTTYNPLTGQSSSTTINGPVGPGTALATGASAFGASGISPFMLIAGIGLIVVLAMKK